MKHTHLIALISLLAILLLLVGGVQAVTWTSANGCWTATDGAYTIVMWNTTTTSTWTPPTVVTNVSYLVVAGGGGGGSNGGGGGGAGGFRNGTLTGLSGSQTVTVGNGGTAEGSGGASVFATISSAGGGYGAGGAVGSGAAGGSGGGSSHYTSVVAGGVGNTPSTTPIQGNDGGSSSGSLPHSGSGGGGSYSAGSNAQVAIGGNGGTGTPNSITGVETYYASGGGGAGGTKGTASAGGGGNGAQDSASNPVAGTANTGGGGGGGYNPSGSGNTGAAGGSGIVIIQYLTPPVAPVASFTSTNISIATNASTAGWAGIAPFTMVFNDTSTGTPTSWVWNATNVTGNNVAYTFNTSTFSAPIYTFATAGNYTIKLNATNAVGSNISTQVTWVNVSSGAPAVTMPIVQFNVDKTVVVFPGRIYFNDTSLNTPTSWNWSFGDGTWYNTTSASLGLNKSYQYVKRGRWIANLTVSNSAGTNTSASKSKSITVIGYQGFELPKVPVPDTCTYSVSRPLNIFEIQKVECLLCGRCEG